jgi:FMN phosphatase YigB (HAD superfamily)
MAFSLLSQSSADATSAGAFPDARAALKTHGARLVILSNGTPSRRKSFSEK